jgi:cysteine desulfurase
LRRAPPLTAPAHLLSPPSLNTGIDIKGIHLRGSPLYLDMQATTPTDPRVLDAMLPWMTERVSGGGVVASTASSGVGAPPCAPARTLRQATPPLPPHISLTPNPISPPPNNNNNNNIQKQRQQFGNPHSRTHMYGWESEAAVEKARAQVASLIGADPKEIVFTSGATESNNLAIKGVAGFYGAVAGAAGASAASGTKRHVVTTQTEHKCVLDSCRWLQQRGWDVTYLPVGKDGRVTAEQVAQSLRPDTALVSIMAVNNEIGVVQPIAAIGAACRERKVFFHTDAAQAAGKIALDVNACKIDLASISGHKLYGPKGVGALYVRRRPRVRLEAQMSGGGQERGLRSGTVPHPLVVGLGAAAEVARLEMAADVAHVKKLEKRLREGIAARLQGVVLNGPEDCGQGEAPSSPSSSSFPARYAGVVNLSFAYVEGESLLMGLKDVAVSSGSACTSASLEPSYVLRALGVEEDMAHTSIRYGLGRFTTEEEVDRAVAMTCAHVDKLREMSPLWEMVQEGVDLKTIQWAQH